MLQSIVSILDEKSSVELSFFFCKNTKLNEPWQEESRKCKNTKLNEPWQEESRKCKNTKLNEPWQEESRNCSF